MRNKILEPRVKKLLHNDFATRHRLILSKFLVKAYFQNEFDKTT
jgi:hypothetical protein